MGRIFLDHVLRIDLILALLMVQFIKLNNARGRLFLATCEKIVMITV